MGGGGEPPAPSPAEVPCDEGNEVEWLNPTDNAPYVVPEDVGQDFINRMAAHAIEMRDWSYEDRVNQFYHMYEDRNNAFFTDFKDWGSSRGPVGSESADRITYWSPAAGQDITGSPYEPFGNFFYGMLMTLAGFAPEETYVYAAAAQSGGWGFITGDAPEDRPHVEYGIAVAQAYMAKGQTEAALRVKEGTCND